MKELLRNKKLMIGLAAIVLLAVVVVIIKRRKTTEESDAVVTVPYGSGDAKLPEASFPLRPKSGGYSASTGSYGQQIADLQKMCNEKYGTSLTVDGKFGPKTEKAFEEKFPVLLFPGEITLNHYNTLMA